MSEADGKPEQEKTFNIGFPAGGEQLELTFEQSNKLYQQAYQELCFAVTGRAPDKEPPDEEEFRQKVIKFLNLNKERVDELVCNKMKWCSLKDSKVIFKLTLKNLVTWALILVDLGATGGYSSATWTILAGVLDEVCGC